MRERDAAIAPADPLRVALAALSGTAGVVHLVMVPSHWGASVLEGLGFAAVGWAQLAIAALLFTRPSRALLVATMVLNAVVVGVWAVSRVWGLPAGSHAWEPESTSIVDLSAVALEVGLIAGCALALWAAPSILASGVNRAVLGIAVPSLAVVLATAALASPDALDHGAHGADGHAHGEVDDRGFSALDNGQHAHADPQPLDDATQSQLDAQLAVTREVAAQYPTVADAEAAGFRRVGPYFPGIGAHYMQNFGAGLNPDGIMDDEDLRNPLMIIYSGTEPDAEIAGFMYYSMAAEEPEGFAGGNDVWHFHENLCLKYTEGAIDVPYGLDNEATQEQCERVGGSIVTQSQWMAHVWSVPGWEMDDADGGVFGEAHRNLDCPDGTYYKMPIDLWADHPLNVCRSELDRT